MCGIAGIFGPEGNVDAVRAMNRIQAHRGPDGEGTWRSRDRGCVLGHRRLSILDLSDAAAQPMVDAAADVALTFNGEIYNFVEVREKLRRLGHPFTTGSDTEVLVRAYAEWGDECLAELNGMFAFALWDGKTRSLFLARDRFGEKPLHYTWLGAHFAFASEAKALALLDGVDLTIDDGVLAAHALHGSTWLDASERTLLSGVRQLLPAHAMRVRLVGGAPVIARQWCYWSVDVGARHGYGEDDEARAAETLLGLLRDSVRLRLRSDVRVGSCLSGGLDSSAVVSLMRRLEPEMELRSFTGRFPGDPLDEGRYAKMVVDASRTTAFETEPTAQRFLEDAPRVYWHADFPIGGMSQFAQWCVFHLASQHDTTVLLDGQGSDEQLGGYGNDITRAFLDQLLGERRFAAFARERRAAARTAPALFSWPKLALHRTPLRALQPLLRRRSGRSTFARSSLFRADWLEAARVRLPDLARRRESAGDEASLSQVLWTLSFRTMLSSLLRFGDRLSMAHSREVRLPFCDHRVAEHAFRISPELLVGSGEVKRVLRRAIRGLVPAPIVTRPKQGFVPPQNGWLVGPLARWIEDLTQAASPVADRLDMARARVLSRAPAEERARDVNAIWETANLLCWSTYALQRMRELRRYPVACTMDTAPVDAAAGHADP